MRHIPIRGTDGTIKEMVPESDVALLALLEIEDEETEGTPEPVVTPPKAATRSRSMRDLLPPDPAAPAAQPKPEPLSARAKVETLLVVLFVAVALIGGMQFLQPRTSGTPAARSTPTLAAVNEAAVPTSAPAPTAQAYAAPDGAQLGPVSLAAMPAPIGRYGQSDWLYFEFAAPVGAVWLRAGELGLSVDPALKDMQPVPTAIPAPWSPPAAPAWSEPVAESAPAPEQPVVNAPDLHAQPTMDIEAIATDPAGEAGNGIKKLLDPDTQKCSKDKQTGVTICT